ncbi:MAG TPA: hypothetical protein VF403_01265 [Kofleriaceae bacterium]
MRALLFVVGLAACGSETTTVGLVAPGEQRYFEGKIDGRPWQKFTGTFDGAATSYELSIDGDFELVMACELRDGRFNAGELFGTGDDATVTIGSWSVPSCVEAEDVAPNVPVTGMLELQGQIAIADAIQFVDLTTPFSLLVTPGVHDIAITSSNFDISIQHDVAIATATDLGTLPFHGSAMVTNDYEASLTADETANGWTEVATRNATTLIFDFDPKMSVFVPPDQLLYGDAQTYHFVAQGNGTNRSAIASGFANTPHQFDLLAPVMPYAWTSGEHSVRWTPITDYYSTLRIEFSSSDGSETATASKLWLDRRALTRITFDETEPPGYHWQTVNPSTTLTAELWSPDLVLESSTTRAY